MTGRLAHPQEYSSRGRTTTRRTGFQRARPAMCGSAPTSAPSPRAWPASGCSAARATISKNAADLAAALGGLKGPMMKVAQLLSTIPEALPPEYARELSQLQSQAPPMGPAFVRRRMIAELGPDWQSRFASFEAQSAASASLGQVHRAVGAGRPAARGQAAVSRHAVGGRGRPHAAQGRVRDPCADGPGRRYARDPGGDFGAAARGARLRAARPATSASMPTCSTAIR